LDFVPTVDDCSIDEETARTLEQEYNIDFASCIGSLIYLGMTQCNIIYEVNKLAKYTRRPGRNHFEALLHMLRYLHVNPLVGIRFYSNCSRAPLIETLWSQEIREDQVFFGFSDSSWNNDVDTGRNTGCFMITYMGGVWWITVPTCQTQ
jgi:hypothetical protein